MKIIFSHVFKKNTEITKKILIQIITSHDLDKIAVADSKQILSSFNGILVEMLRDMFSS